MKTKENSITKNQISKNTIKNKANTNKKLIPANIKFTAGLVFSGLHSTHDQAPCGSFQFSIKQITFCAFNWCLRRHLSEFSPSFRRIKLRGNTQSWILNINNGRKMYYLREMFQVLEGKVDGVGVVC